MAGRVRPIRAAREWRWPNSMERFANLVSMFFARAAEKGDAPFLWEKYAGRWRALSWSATAEAVARVAEALTELGLERGDRVLLLSRNRREWCIADLGIMAAGGITVPAYVTGTPADQAHVLADSGAKIAIVQLRQAGDLDLALAGSPECRHVIMIEPSTPLPAGHVGHNWSDLLSRQAGNVAACAAFAARLTRDDLACLIYTSGTSGTPKGVQQHHGMILHNVEGCHAIIADDFPAAPDRFLSFLPLSHAYEHSAGQFLPIGLGAEIWYAESLERLAGNIAEARPTVMVVVPRLFEVLRDKIVRGLTERGRVIAWIARQALALAARDNGKRGDRLRRTLVARSIAPVVRQRFGGSIKAMVSGGAPLTPEVGRFFELMGLPVLQGYGQTEAGPVVSCNRPASGVAVATVGPPLPGTELRIAEDGEILVRGENVMHGYWQRPGDTAQTLVDGWLHTGDVGIIDDAGRLKITDRKKDIIVNDKGENVAPQRIEGLLALQPEIFQAMVFGDRRPHLVGLIVPDPEWSRSWATAHGVADEAMLRNNPAYVAALQTAVDRVSRTLSPVEKVRKIAVADSPFTIDNCQLTPSLKLRRQAVREIYRERLEALYGRG
jgi:long-chain acyl-CoA synthetase